MASIIRVKRSTGTLAPATLNYGELGLTIGIGTHGNKGGRLFAGDNASNPQVVGGRYYTDLLSIEPGRVAGQVNPTTPSNGFVAIVDSTGRVDQWNVDNLRLDGNALTSTDTDGHITITPDGTGRVQFLDDDELQFGTSDDIRVSYDTAKDALFIERGTAGTTADVRVADDIHFQFGTDNDARIYYDEIASDRLVIEGASWTYANSVSQVAITTNTSSTNSTTGAFVVTGGVGIGGTVNIQGDLAVEGGDVTSANSNLNLFNSSVLTANILGAGTDIVFGATTGITTIRNALVDLDGDLNIDGADLTTNQTEFNLLETNATTINAFGSATSIDIGANTGITTINNATFDVPNATTVTIGAQNSVTSVTFESTPNTSYVSIAATTNATSTTTGALRVSGGVGIVSDVYIGGDLYVDGNQNFTGSQIITGNLTVNGNTNLGNESTDLVVITGIVTHIGPFANTGGMTIDNIGISSNTISTRPGGGNVLYLDPYPDGLSNEGTVVIKGDLQVDGTTTTVNSNAVSINDAILNLGDVTSVRTVMSTVGTGVSAITLDSVVGINTGDVISGSASLPGAGTTTIHSYDSGTKVIYIDGITTAGITTTTQLTVTHAYDTNTDRGISFDYNTSSGTANNKIGFFGFDDSSLADGTVTPTTYGTHADGSRRWTYVPDATITNGVVAGTKGFLDVKGIYYQSGDFNTNGAVYFDSQGLQRSTNNPNTASGTRTSTQLLTAVTEITLDLPSAYTVVAGEQVTQLNNSAAYGVVKSSSSGTTITLIGVQGTFDTTNDLKVEGANISLVPSTVTTVYTNKPTWTDTLDGGTF
jgi:hypothetical protein